MTDHATAYGMAGNGVLPEAGKQGGPEAGKQGVSEAGQKRVLPEAGKQGSPFTHAAPEGAAKSVSAVLGEIVWLMSQSPAHKSFFISDLEWLVMTPVLLQQFRLFYDQEKPIGVVLWASVDAEVAARLAAGTSKMRPQDWKSGDALWVAEVIAPFGGAEEMVKDLKARVFPTRDIHMLATNADGRKEGRVV